MATRRRKKRRNADGREKKRRNEKASASGNRSRKQRQTKQKRKSQCTMAGTALDQGMLGAFRAEDDFIIFAARFKHFCAANGIEEEGKKIAQLLGRLSEDVFRTVKNLAYPTVPEEKTLNELIELLKQHYSPQVNTYRERIEFYRASQSTGESTSEWYARIKGLSVNCEFTNLVAILKDRFISGMKQGKVLDRLVEEDVARPIADLLRIARSREMADENSSTCIQAIRGYGGKSDYKGPAQTYSGKSDYKTLAQTQRGPQHFVQHSRRTADGPYGGQRQRRDGCKCCGRSHKGQCRYVGAVCDACGRVGHLRRICRTPRHGRINAINPMTENGQNQPEDSNEDVEKVTEYPIYVISLKNRSPITIDVAVNDVDCRFELDTGSAVSTISKDLYIKKFKQCILQPTKLIFKGYTGEEIIPEGYLKVSVNFNNMRKDLKIYIIPNAEVCLLGRDFVTDFDLSFSAGINNMSSHDVKAALVAELPDVCTERLGCFKYAKISLKLKADAIPRCQRPRPVPLALKTKIEYELDRLQQKGIIVPTVSTEWASPIVPVLRKNNTVRICGSYVSLNESLADIYYPLPLIEQIYASLSGSYKFSKIDLSDAYLQFQLDEESSKLVTISTHKGLFNVVRMPFGVKCSSFYFQKHIDNLFQGKENVFTFQDDILIGHKQGENHMESIRKVLHILGEAGLTVNVNKCQFLQDKISYLGCDLTKAGLSKNEDKVKAIIECPKPTNLSELRSFIGLINYYGKFIDNLANRIYPLYQLLKKDVKFIWSKECDRAFDEIRNVIASDTVLTYFNPKLPIIVTCDASDKGIGATLSHVMPDKTERVVVYISRTYSKFEQNYSTVHKESLACYFAIQKLQEYLYGHKFVLRTDQKALISLFGKNREISQTYANRIKRYALYLSNFDFTIEHIPGKNNVIADFLSRHPIACEKEDLIHHEEPSFEKIYFSNVHIPIDRNQLKAETQKDDILCQVIKYTQSAWPHKVDDRFRPYFNRKLDLEVSDSCLFFGERAVIPTSMQHNILMELHSGHDGIVRTKSLARSYIWFPNMDKRIEELCKSCQSCQKFRNEPPKSVANWPEANTPFHTVHVDFFTLNNLQFLVIIDTYTKWPEVYVMKNITSEKTVANLRDCFARFGLPYCLVSDNAPNLVSEEMETFLFNNGIKHMTIAPYNPQSNGLAENMVKTLKSKLKTAIADPKNLNTQISILLARLLLAYRTTPHSTTKKSPAELMFNRKLKMRLGWLVKNVNSDLERKSSHKLREFDVGTLVTVRDYRVVNRKSWRNAVILQRLGRVMYSCELETGEIWRRHANQIRTRVAETCQTGPELQVVPRLIPTKKLGFIPKPASEVVVSAGSGLNRERLELPEPHVEPTRVDASGGSDAGDVEALITPLPTPAVSARPGRKKQLPARYRD